MRKNTQLVFNAWKSGKSLKVGEIRTDGVKIYSYATEIVKSMAGRIVFNDAKYSVTTTRQQNDLKFLLRQNGFDYITL